MTDTQTFKLYGPSGEVIMTGSMNAILERLPDTHARNDALSTMLDTAVKAVEAEEQLEEARATAAQILSDGITRITHRLDQFEKARAISAKRAEAARKEAEQRRVQRYLDQLPDPDLPDDPEAFGIIPPAQDPTGTSLEDDGDLEIKKAQDPERYGPTDDEGPGDLPRKLEQDVPPLSGSYTNPKPDPLGGPEKPKQVTQPISASFW
jgi:hypothetical protein